MLVPVKWLKDYVDVDCDIKELADRMIMSGSNIETVEKFAEESTGVVVGKIIKCDKHPDADKLKVCLVDVGKEEPLQIVCGAANAAEGLYAPVATDGAHIPGPLHGQPKQEGGVTIHAGTLRGVESQGMLCACSELGFDSKIVPVSHAEGIWILPEDLDLVPGTPIAEALDLEDDIIDFEITPNRSDCLAMLGMARETSATFDIPFTYPDVELEEKGEGKSSDYIAVEIKDDHCKRFTARVVTDVKIAQSPWWLQKRLMEAGMRPINNIVDVTNFVMMELGYPIHAYDIREIKGGKIVVDMAKAGDTFTTLDGKERELTDSMLMIQDAEGNIGIAGIMGGLDSEIKDDTTTIVVEAANFEGDNIRLTSKALKHRTEASSRFEKGLDPNLAEMANDRVCKLIEILGAGTVQKGIVDVYPDPVEPWTVDARVARINHILGTDFDKQMMIDIFHRLEMEVEDKGDVLTITPPTCRLDMNIEEDCAEEIARIYGYDRLPTTIPKGASVSSFGRPETLRRMARQAMAAMGANEIQTYSFVSPTDADRLRIAEDSPLRNVVPLINPLGEDTSVMRTMMLPEMLETLGRNWSRNIETVVCYEIGNTFTKISEDLDVLPEEADAMTIGIYGKGKSFFTLKGMVEELMKAMGISPVVFEKDTENKAFHPGRCAKIFIGEKKVYVGTMGEIHPDVADDYGIGTRVYATELAFKTMGEYAATEVSYTPLPKYPAMQRDIALVVDEAVTVSEIEDVIRANGGELLESVKLFDIYRGVQVGPGKKSLAFNLVYRDPDKTLTEEEVTPVHENVLNILRETMNAVLREM